MLDLFSKVRGIMGDRAVVDALERNPDLMHDFNNLEDEAERFLDDEIKKVYDEAYEDGYQVGLTEGQNDTSSDRYDEGYEDGHSDGYNDGYSSGLDDGYTNGYEQAEIDLEEKYANKDEEEDN